MSVELANESGSAVDETALVGLARHVLAQMGVHPLAELSVLLVDAPTMGKLHERWTGEPDPTDVLAFPMDELDTGRGPDEEEPPPTLLGDVVLCPEVARRQAATVGHSAQDELELLCTHGILHLLGYDHDDADEEREMFRRQAELVGSWAAARGAGRPGGGQLR